MYPGSADLKEEMISIAFLDDEDFKYGLLAKDTDPNRGTTSRNDFVHKDSFDIASTGHSGPTFQQRSLIEPPARKRNIHS